MRKRVRCPWRETLAVLITVVAAVMALSGMWRAEGHVDLKHLSSATNPAEIVAYFNHSVLPGIQDYSIAIGGLLLAVSIAFILLGAEEELSTAPDESTLKK